LNKSSIGARLAAAPYLVWSVLFVVAPLLMVVYYAFTDDSGNFTFLNFAQLGSYSDVFVRSIWFSLIATVVCLVLAYPVAYLIAMRHERTQRVLVMLIMLPMWMNFLLRTYSWMAILEDTGVINSILSKLGLSPVHMINTPGAVILGMVYNYLPYMILPIYSVLAKLERSMIEAAQDLGANRWQVFTRIILPHSMPGIASGLTMVFVPSVSTFYISQKLGGGKFDLIGDTIERQFQTSYNYHLGAAISFVLMVLILVCMAALNKFAADDEGGLLI